MSPDLAIPASPAALRNEGSGFLPLTAKAASFSGIGYARRNGVTLCTGQFQGGFALCTVTGVEILDQDFQRVNPIEIEAPTRGYVRMTLPGSTSSTVQRKVRIEREGGPVITPDTPVTLSRVGASAAYLAPITLKPEGSGASAAAPFAALEPIPELTIALGPNNAVVTNPDGGGVDAKCGVDFPALLRLRFLKRDGTGLTAPAAGDPQGETGLLQETSIGPRSDGYPEVVTVEIQAVNQFDMTSICQYCTAEVGIEETPNPGYSTETRRFFDGRGGSTSLEGKKIDGAFRSLVSGRVSVDLKAVAESRRDTTGASNGRGNPVPFTLVPSVPAYDGLSGARLTAVPGKAGNSSRQVKTGPQQAVALWVDERWYLRKRGDPLNSSDPNSNWTGSPNGTRDWIEKKVLDFYADWTGDSEIQTGMERVGSISDTNDPAAAFVAETSVTSATPTCAPMKWCLWSDGVRKTASPAQLDLIVYDQAGLKATPSHDPSPDRDAFAQTAIHEARHAWQYTLVASSGQTDNDSDFAFPGPPASAGVLKDARFSLDGGGDGGNPEYDLLGDGIVDFFCWLDDPPTGEDTITRVVREVDAIRKSGTLTGAAVGCLGAYTLGNIQKVGNELHLSVTFTKTFGQVMPYEGATVIWSIVPGDGGTTGNALLSEQVANLPLATMVPGYYASLRSDATKVVSRARYTDATKTVAESRVSVVWPTDTHTTTRILATLALPAAECGGATRTKTAEVP